MTIENWKRKAEGIVASTDNWDTSDKITFSVLISYVEDIKRKEEPAYTKAKQWFSGEAQAEFSIHLVCDTLGLNVHDLRRRLRKMEEHDK